MQPSMRSKAAFSIISTTTCSIGGAGGGIDCPAAVSQRWQQVDAALGLANAPFAFRVPEFARRLSAPAQQEVAGAVDLGRQIIRAAVIGVQLDHQPAMRLLDLGRSGATGET